MSRPVTFSRTRLRKRSHEQALRVPEVERDRVSRVYKIPIPSHVGLTYELGPIDSLTDAIRICEEKKWSTDLILTAEETKTYSEWKKAMPD